MVKRTRQAASEAPPQDILDDFLRILLELAPGFSRAVAEQAAARVRHDWAGEAARVCYIARHGDQVRSQRNTAIVRDYLAGERVAFLARRYRLSERRILQIVKG